MAIPGYASLEEIDENSSESLPLANRDPFVNNAATRYPSKAQTFPLFVAHHIQFRSFFA
jgi:hypothetical protein